MMTPDEIARLLAPGPKPPMPPRPLPARFFDAYALGYRTFGTTGERARQYGEAHARLLHRTHKAALRYWKTGYHDAADHYPMRYRLRTPTRTRRAPIQIALFALEEERDG